MARKIEYSEPSSYFPKEVRDKVYGKTKKATPKKTPKKK